MCVKIYYQKLRPVGSISMSFSDMRNYFNSPFPHVVRINIVKSVLNQKFKIDFPNGIGSKIRNVFGKKIRFTYLSQIDKLTPYRHFQ